MRRRWATLGEGNQPAVGRPRGSKTRRRGPGRPRKAATPAAALGQIVKQIRDLEKEVASLRSALSKIADLALRV
jgi:hypothetical protein